MRRLLRKALVGSSLFAALFAPAVARAADAVADFYKGRQIIMVLSADAGGGYGSYANAFAPYLAAHRMSTMNAAFQMPSGDIRTVSLVQPAQ